jgi:hypothetical protein
MKKLSLFLFSILLVLLVSEVAEAQFSRSNIKKNNKRIANYRGRKSWFGKEKIYNAVGFSVNALNYYGDIAPLPKKISTDISFTRPAFAISFAHRFGPRYTLMGQFMWGTLSASDKSASSTGESGYRNARNLSFRNRIKELSVTAYFDLFKNESTYISRVSWTPYLYLGVAGFLHNPQAKAPTKDLNGNPLKNGGQWVDLQPLGTEGQYSKLSPTDVNYGIKPYSLAQVAIPFGIGARFKINEVMDLWADIGFRYTFTDYLDDVSANYVNLDQLTAKSAGDNQLARAMSYRTNELGANGTTPPTTVAGHPVAGQQLYAPSAAFPGGLAVEPGYGYEFTDNVRGNKKNVDIYMVTSIRVTYILGATFHKAKFR